MSKTKVKVLWFSATPALYEDGESTSHNGGGWISSLQKIMENNSKIDLSIAFEHTDKIFKIRKNNVTYYPISYSSSVIYKLRRRISLDIEEKKIIPYCLNIIDDIKPDIIQVFGSEWCFGLISPLINIPVIIHLQGSIPPYFNAFYPPGISSSKLFLHKWRDPLWLYRFMVNIRQFKYRAKREERILRVCKYFMGRTEWDMNLTKLYNNNSIYYHCDEALREKFVERGGTWKHITKSKYTIITTISSPIYKGVDLILKTAKLLKENTELNYEWKIFGVNDISLYEKILQLKAVDINVRPMGVFSSERLTEELLKGDIYVHSSYIDNSPNSLCEAQILGMPVISTNVGGISSIVQHKATGLLFPANDPYTCAVYIMNILNNKILSSKLGKQAYEIAIKRHDVNIINQTICNIYGSILESSIKCI